MLILNDQYQKGAVERGASCLRDLTGDRGVAGTIILTAPTGAGKTAMIAAMLAEAGRNAYVLWATPGKGNLEEQSYAALTSHLTGTPINVERLSPEYLAQNATGSPGTVVVTNWEELVQTTRDGGEPVYKNRLTVGSESAPGLLEHLAATGRTSTPVIVVIDESHYGKGESAKQTSAVTAFLDAIDSALGYPAVRLEASATPILAQIDTRLGLPSRYENVDVTLDSVIEAGMIADEVRVNSGIREIMESLTPAQREGQTGERLVLTGAWNKIQQLRKQYAQIGSPVKPLLLVQLPNKRGTDQRDQKIREVVTEFFRDHGITEENGRLAVMLSGETRDVDAMAKVASFDSPIEVLIFKQGISLGWDCPRAQILLAFRDMASEIFKIQTIGRILRMPERKHYNIPDLNAAYIYSNIEMTAYKQVPAAPPVITTEFRRAHDVCRLPIEYVSRAGGFNDLTKPLILTAYRNDQEAQKLPATLRFNDSVARLARHRTAAELVSDQAVTQKEIHEGLVADDEDTRVAVNMSHGQLESKFEDYLIAAIPFGNKARSLPVAKDFLYGWLRSAFRQDLDPESRILGTQRLILAPRLGKTVRDAFERMLRAAHTANTEAAAAPQVFPAFWSATETMEWDDTNVTRLDPEDTLSPLCLYQDALKRGCIPSKKLSSHEDAFLDLLRLWVAQKRVRAWWKSSEGDRRFPSVVYTNTDGDQKTTYPDFIVWFTDGRVGLFETKEPKMEQGIDRQARAKAPALLAYPAVAMSRYGSEPALDDPNSVVAGVVYKIPTGWMLAGASEDADTKLEPYLFPEEN